MKKNQENIDYAVSSGNVFVDLGLDQPEELLARAKLLCEVSRLIKNSSSIKKKGKVCKDFALLIY